MCGVVQIMKRLLEQFNSSNTTTEQRVSILQELEYLVHQVTQCTMYTHCGTFTLSNFVYVCVCVRWTMLTLCAPWGVSR